MKARNIDGQPRVYGIQRGSGITRGSDFFRTRNAMRPGEKIMVSYDDGRTWYDLGRSPVSKDDRPR
jgi:hypothetical protein